MALSPIFSYWEETWGQEEALFHWWSREKSPRIRIWEPTSAEKSV